MEFQVQARCRSQELSLGSAEHLEDTRLRGDSTVVDQRGSRIGRGVCKPMSRDGIYNRRFAVVFFFGWVAMEAEALLEE